MKGPLEKHLASPLDDSRVQRIAQQLKASRGQRETRLLRFAVAGLATAALATAWVTFRRAPEPQPVALEGGAALPVKLEGRVPLDDGSLLALEPDAAAELVANQPGRLTVLLKQGHARFEVNPASHRQWVVEAGLATIEVVGTVFSVARDTTGVTVFVERGAVVVRSDRLPDGVQRVDAGKGAFVPALREPPPAQPEAVAPPPPSEPAPVARPSKKSFDELLAIADEARANGEHELAAKALSRALAIDGTHPSAPSAAFILGRLELEQLHRPDDAAAHFERAAVGALTEDACVRRVEALVTAGRTDAAVLAAQAALGRFSTGPRAEKLKRWLDDPQHAVTWLR